MDQSKKYLINVDFSTKSVIHLNPPISQNCTRAYGRELGRGDSGGAKLSKEGGLRLATEAEARAYITREDKLLWNGKEVKNLTRCGNCTRSTAYTI